MISAATFINFFFQLERLIVIRWTHIQDKYTFSYLEMREMQSFSKNIMNQFNMIILKNPNFGPIINSNFK